LDSPELLDRRVIPDLRVMLECPALLAKSVRKAVQGQWVLPVWMVLLAYKAARDPQVHRVQWVRRGKLVPLDHKVILVRWVQMERSVPQVRKDQPDHKVTLVSLEPPDRRVIQDLRVMRVWMEPLAHKDSLVPQDHKDSLVQRERPALLVPMVRLDRLDPKVVQEPD